MNDNAKKWVDALRHGGYDQTRGSLTRTSPSYANDPVGHCCLGVACELFADELGLQRHDTPHGTIEYWAPSTGAGRRSSAFLPETVRAHLGLQLNGGEYEEGTLYDQNDQGLSFAEIADLIESEPEGLFEPFYGPTKP